MKRYEKKIYYVTQAQYDSLKEGETITIGGNSYTGIEDDASYFVRSIPDIYELSWDDNENQIQLMKNGAESGDPITIQYASYAANAGSLGGSSADDFVNVAEEQEITGSKTFSSIISGSITGNAGTATKLATPRAIGGVNFDGSANIDLPGVNTLGTQNTTGNAGTATRLLNGRTFTIGSTSKSFDGTANVSWTLAEIGASPTTHTHDDRYYTKYDINNSPIVMREVRVNPNGEPSSNLGSPSIAEMGLFQEQFNNKTEFHDINNIVFEEYNGSTWTDVTTTITETYRKAFVGGDANAVINIPSGAVKYRITLRATSYSYLNALYMYYSTQGNNTKVHIWKKHDNGDWIQHTNSDKTVSSWPGHLFLPFSTIAWHNNATLGSHYHEVRIEFTPTWSNANPIILQKLQIWGGYPAYKRTIYSVNSDKEVTFPETITGTRLISNVATGTAPLTVASTTQVNNLNADLLDGKHANEWFTNPVFTGTTSIGSGSDTWTITDETDDQLRFSYDGAGTVILPKVSGTKTIAFTDSVPNVGSLITNSAVSQSPVASESFTGNITLHKISKTGVYSDLIDLPPLKTVATTGSYADLTNKPTIPATNVIPATTTANKIIVSTTTSGTAKWSDWTTAGFLKTNTSGLITIDTNTYLTSVPNDHITNARLANMATATIKGRVTTGTGDPEDLTQAQVRTFLGLGSAAYTASSSYLGASHAASGVTALRISNWDTAYGWGNHALAGYVKSSGVTSVAMSVPTGLAITGSPITSTGTLALSLASGYSIPTTAKQSNWDAAHSHSTTTTGAVHGATTVGNSFFRLTNPSAITFPRINADNTVTTLSASAFRAAIGAGTSSTTGTVTSVGGTGTVSGITLTGAVTTTGNLTLGGSISGLTTSNLSASANIANTQLANSSITIGSTAISLGSSSTTLTGLTSVTSTALTTGTGTQTWTITDTTSQLKFINGGTVILPKVSTGTKTIAFTDSVPNTTQINTWTTAASDIADVINGDVAVPEALEANYATRAGVAPVPIGGNYSGSPRNLFSYDANKYIRISDQGSPVTVILPLSASNAMSIGDEIHICSQSTLDVTITVGSGLTLNSLDSKVKIAGQYGVVTLKKITSTLWHLFGALK